MARRHGAIASLLLTARPSSPPVETPDTTAEEIAELTSIVESLSFEQEGG